MNTTAFAMVASARTSLDRAGRVRFLREAAEALLDGKVPEREAAIFLGGAIAAWLELGGSLEHDFLKVTNKGDHAMTFRFELGDEAELLHSEEKGEVIGRTEFAKAEPSYLLLYRSGDGRQVKAWWSDSALA